MVMSAKTIQQEDVIADLQEKIEQYPDVYQAIALADTTHTNAK
jgi:hypothetical protein